MFGPTPEKKKRSWMKSADSSRHRGVFKTIRLEPGPRPQTMMRVDSRNFSDNLVCFIIIFVMTLITAVIACSYKQQYKSLSRICKISSMESDHDYISPDVSKCEISLNSLSVLSRFLMLCICFRRADSTNIAETRINISAKICLVESTGVAFKVFEFESVEYPIRFNKNSLVSIEIPIFLDTLIQYRQVHADVLMRFKNNVNEIKTLRLLSDAGSFNNENVEYINSKIIDNIPLMYSELNWKYGDDGVTLIIIFTKSVFWMATFICFLFYLRLIYRIGYSMFTPEQKATFILIILSILKNCPVSHINIFKFQRMTTDFYKSLFLIANTICLMLETMFNVYVPIFIYLILNNVKRQSSKLDNPFKIIIYVIYFLSSSIIILVSIINCFFDLKNQFIVNIKIAGILDHITLFCECLFFIIIMLLIIKISFTVDETEIFRFVVYSIHIFLLLIVSFIVRLLESRNKLNSLYSIIELTAYDVFVIEIGYLHWTYKVTIDVSYQDPAIQENKPDIDIDKVSDDQEKENDSKHESTESTDSTL